jgi:SAM-dependent methyltransferase
LSIFAEEHQEVAEMHGKRGHFQAGGSEYARYRPTYPPELIDALAEISPACDLAVDVGCGSGQLSVLLAERFGRVVATDVSEAQLASAVAHPRVTYRHEAAEAIGVETGQADLVVAAQAAHWFDLPAFYREVRRVAGEGAVIALISYGVPYLESPLNARFQRFYWQDLHPFWPPERYHVETGYTELLFPFETIAMPGLAIRREWTLREFLGYLRTWSAWKRAVEQGRQTLLSEFESTLAGLWGGHLASEFVVWPISLRVGRVKG